VGLDATGKPQYSFYGDKAPEASLLLADLPQLDDAVQGIHVGSYAW
jgi:fructokinase